MPDLLPDVKHPHDSFLQQYIPNVLIVCGTLLSFKDLTRYYLQVDQTLLKMCITAVEFALCQ